MAKEMEFFGEGHLERHECESRRKGDLIIFKCPQCNYERHMNIQTGEMYVKEGNMTALHSGMHWPIGVQPDRLSLN